jgi:3-oxoacyl-[acyl-carrier-protein] synthase-3
MNTVYIRSIGYYIPQGRLTNSEVLKRLRKANQHHLKEEDLELLVYGSGRKFEFLGIDSRSICAQKDGDNTVTMAVNAARNALAAARLECGELDCVISCGVSNPFREPTFALVLAHMLGMESGDFFDINDTCNGFLKSMDVAARYMAAGMYKHVLITASENPYELAPGLGIDYTVPDLAGADNRFGALLAGSGAAAVVLSVEGDERRIINYREKRETLNWDASVLTVPGIALPGGAPLPPDCGFRTDARLISSQVIKDIPAFAADTVAEWNMTLEDFNLFIMHQLGNNVTFATLDRLKLDHARAPINTFREYGNMASANIPVNLALAEEQGKVHRGDSVLLLSSACGLSYALMHIQW